MKNNIKTKFSIIANSVVTNNDMTAGAKGVACYLMSKPDGWQFYMEEIANNFKDSYSMIQKYVKELENCGFLIRTKRKNEKGLFVYDYDINTDFNTIIQKSIDGLSSSGFAADGSSVPGSTITGILTTNNTNYNNTDNSNTDYSNIDNTISLDHQNLEENSFFLEIAKGLQTMVESKKRIKVGKIQLLSWTKEIKSLFSTISKIRGKEQALDDIKKAIQFLIDHSGEEYIPVVESGKTFKDKFSKIEDAIKRQKKRDFMRVDVNNLVW